MFVCIYMYVFFFTLKMYFFKKMSTAKNILFLAPYLGLRELELISL